MENLFNYFHFAFLQVYVLNYRLLMLSKILYILKQYSSIIFIFFVYVTYNKHKTYILY